LGQVQLVRIRPQFTWVIACLTLVSLAMFACGRTGQKNQPSPTVPVAAHASPSTGCALPRAPGDYSETLESGGRSRSYLLHIPPRYGDATPAGLVFAFHGYGLTAQFFAQYTALATSADQRHDIVVFPQALGDNLVWNVSRDASQPDDASFATELLDHLEQTLCVDRARIYATGFSLGGEMSQLLACLLPGRIAAIGVVASAFSSCTAPVPLLVIHGTTDPSIPYLGGTYPLDIGGGRAPAIREVVERWASGLGCTADVRIEQPAPDVTVSTHTRCKRGGNGVVLYVVQNGGHSWPGSPRPVAEAFVGRSTNSISASELIMEFLGSHRLPE
jgi:polyhydroxybutyrate depolymerase